MGANVARNDGIYPYFIHLSTLLDENVTVSLSSKHVNSHPHHDLTSYFTEKIGVSHSKAIISPLLLVIAPSSLLQMSVFT